MDIHAVFSLGAPIFVAASGVAHFAFFVKEFFGGQKLLEKNYGLQPDVAKNVANILKNAGFYNLGIAIGLGLTFIPSPHQFVARVFFLSFAIAAGLVGFSTLPPKVGLLALAGQSVVGALALALVFAV